MVDFIEFDKKLYKRLKADYNKAVKEGNSSFTFNTGEKDLELNTDYAKYLIKYLEDKGFK